MDFASLWRGNDSSSNKQQNQTSERQPANEGESVLMCCIHSQLLIRYWDFVFMETEGLILEQRLQCSVGRLRRSWSCPVPVLGGLQAAGSSGVPGVGSRKSLCCPGSSQSKAVYFNRFQVSLLICMQN